MDREDRILSTLLKATEEYFLRVGEEMRKEKNKRSKRIMAHYGGSIAILASRECHEKLYPEVPYDNPKEEE